MSVESCVSEHLGVAGVERAMVLPHDGALPLFLMTLAACGAAPRAPSSEPMTDGAFQAELDAVPLMASPEAARAHPLSSAAGGSAEPPPRPRLPAPRTHRSPICVGTAPLTRPSAGHLNGHIARSTIQAPIRARAGAVRICYERALVRAPELRGRLAIQFKVDFDGVVRQACEARDESKIDGIDDSAFVTCVAEVFTTLRFPELSPDMPSVTVTYPFDFQPG